MIIRAIGRYVTSVTERVSLRNISINQIGDAKRTK
jgi:hypothetical protein